MTLRISVDVPTIPVIFCCLTLYMQIFLYAGERMALFVGPVPEDKLPKDATPGRLLAGSVILAKPSNGGGGAGSRPGVVFDASSIAPGCILVD